MDIVVSLISEHTALMLMMSETMEAGNGEPRRVVSSFYSTFIWLPLPLERGVVMLRNVQHNCDGNEIVLVHRITFQCHSDEPT